MTHWCAVVAVSPLKDGRIRCELACGNSTTLNAIAPIEAIREPLLRSCVPCAVCNGPHGGRLEPLPLRRTRAGLAEAAVETRRQARVERMWAQECVFREEVIRARGEYL